MAIGRLAPQPDAQPVSRRRGTIPVDRSGLAVVVDHEIEVPVGVEVPQRRAEAHAEMIEPPPRALLGEAEVATIPEGVVGILLRLARGPEPGGRVPVATLHDRGLGLLEVAVKEVTGHAIGRIHVQPSVIVEVAEEDGPGPIRGREPSLMGNLEEALTAAVEVDGVAHVLAWRRIGQEPALLLHVTHANLVLVVSAARHIRRHEVGQAIVVQVARVGTHRVPRRVWHRRSDHIGEGDLPGRPGRAIVLVKVILAVKIVGDVEVRAAVLVVVPPHRGEAHLVAGDSRGSRHIAKPSTLVAEEPVGLACRKRLDPGTWKIESAHDLAQWQGAYSYQEPIYHAPPETRVHAHKAVYGEKAHGSPVKDAGLADSGYF